MSRKRRQQQAAPAAPSGLRLVVLLAVVGAAAVLVARSWRSEPASPAPGSAPGNAPDAAATPPASASSESGAAGGQTAPELQGLLGEWVRPDGGYVLSVQGVAPDGSARVEYFNPRPIRVARAEARHEDGVPSLFVKFDDVNYPGSTYTLAYDATSDALRGVYFQAVQQARYEVAFVRRR